MLLHKKAFEKYNLLMVNVAEEEEKKVRCLLVGAPDKTSEGENGKIQELVGLTDTLGMEVADIIVLNRIEKTAAYGIGTGKAQEISDKAKEVFADCIIFDWGIDPSKQRNWEKLASKPVFDRNEVIIRIFAQRAQTKEAALQVELAKLKYSLPRISHMYGDLARQRGGNYGAKGSGETKAELDRRQIEDKIISIEKELKQVETNRETQRKQRERTCTASCALVGYTNAGKSSLLNELTGADVFVENKLFATLDPTTRKLALAEGSSVLITDTVGFISNLPHTLIDAFKSTLEETALSNLLLIVVDASDENCIFQYEQVLEVLKEINADEIPRITVLNKIDCVKNDPLKICRLNAQFPDAVKVSARTHEGFDTLLALITESLLGTSRTYVLPFSRSDLVDLARKNGTIEKEEWLEDGVYLTARLNSSSRTFALLKPYLK